MLIAEELLVLLTRDSGKPARPTTEVDRALAGAVLIELATLGLVDVAGPGEPVRRGGLVLRTGPRPDHPVLRAALDVLGQREGRSAKSAVEKLARGLRASVTDSLLRRRVLERRDHRVLGLFPATRTPVRDRAVAARLRGSVVAALTGPGRPEPHAAALVTLLHAIGALTTAVDLPDPRAAKARAKQISQGDWAADAVRKAVAAVNAVVIGVVVSATAAANS
ncbi:GOLPH3/VPS74 family protein [Actinokineospora bangkokensis]|uniref:GPP34 family phosphoprotein n=1 Tax=Actinokineospora bangkokensis TaxID=1193682 RepID=A0A1Q9LDV8_9PSEU|nr:GPP34 family phosphoprotein [Actinokineospora bangkokensis]OLR90228.1 hypothetical protein BJP25_04540 [Actinokineospora bangkokensis]